MIKVLKLFRPQSFLRRSSSAVSGFNNQLRFFADAPTPDTTSKQVVVQGTENEPRIRVRRARPSDTPRLLRFVKEHARYAWPCCVPPVTSPATNLVLCDYVARALAQGHSMVAEQHSGRQGWIHVRGVALGVALCPWEAGTLESLARCVQCSQSKRLLQLTAHCLRAPMLHSKYQVHNILQVILIVPPDTPKNAEIVQVLAKNAIQRGRDIGFPLIRFDATTDFVASSLETLQVNKEWYLAYDVVQESKRDKLQEKEGATSTPDDAKKHFVAVYSVQTRLPEQSMNNPKHK